MSVIRMTPEQYQAHQRRVRGVVQMPPEKRGKGVTLKSSKPKPEDMLAAEMTAAGLVFKRQYCWHPGRRFRADFCFVDHRMLVEVEGCVHMMKAMLAKDIEKSQQALILGYRLLRVSNAQVKAGEAMGIVQQALAVVMIGDVPADKVVF